MKQLLLASTSPRRKLLMKKIGVPFISKDSGFTELPYNGEEPKTYVLTQTLGKAKMAAQTNPNTIIVSGDCDVFVDNTILGKPADKKDAKRMLNLLSGKTHTVFTGYAVLDTESNKLISGVEQISVTFKKLSDKEINDYIDKGDCMDKAGAYAIQSVKDRFVTKLIGDYDSVMGFATNKVAAALHEIAPEFFNP